MPAKKLPKKAKPKIKRQKQVQKIKLNLQGDTTDVSQLARAIFLFSFGNQDPATAFKALHIAAESSHRFMDRLRDQGLITFDAETSDCGEPDCPLHGDQAKAVEAKAKKSRN